MADKSFLRRKIIDPFLDLLRQGITPEKLALTIALGVVLGVTPVLGSTTILCAAAALALRLNLPAIQLVNGLTYPLQIAMIVPFLKAGAWVFGDQATKLSIGELLTLVRTDLWRTVASLWTATLHALAVWFIGGAIATAILYLILLPILRMGWRAVHRDNA